MEKNEMTSPMLIHLLCIIGALEVNVADGFNVWSEWSTWRDCTPRCQIGTQTRTRTCVSHPCAGDHLETQACNTLCGCQLMPCMYGNTCIQDVGDPEIYVCACQSGYAGQSSLNCNTTVGSGDTPINVESNSSYITSPFYPNLYPVLLVTRWTITTSADTAIKFDFTEFNVGPADSPTNCTEAYADTKTVSTNNTVGLPRLSSEEITEFCPCVLDLVLIYNGEGTNLSDLQGVYCNAQPPPANITSRNSTVTIVFRTDIYNITDVNKTNQGFNVTLSQTDSELSQGEESQSESQEHCVSSRGQRRDHKSGGQRGHSRRGRGHHGRK